LIKAKKLELSKIEDVPHDLKVFRAAYDILSDPEALKLLKFNEN
jgi:hypothetical protein